MLTKDVFRRLATSVSVPPQRDRYLPGPSPDPEALISKPEVANTGALGPQDEPGGRSTCLDALQARADEAVYRIAVGDAARGARALYMARLECHSHAQAEPAAQRQAEASDGIEIEP
jgi:hypothetical protein